MKIISLIVALLPVLLFLIWIYKKDKYNKEPIKDLVKFYIIGVMISFVAIVIERKLVDFNVFEGIYSQLYLSFLVAGTTEEFLKAIVLTIVLFKDNKFNEKIDGIIYSVVLSLGFASIENIIYLFYETENLIYQVGILRSVIAIPGHIMFGIMMGYYISKAKFSDTKSEKINNIFKAIIIPIILHAIFDFILMIGERWSIILFIVYIGLLYFNSLKKLDEYTDIARIRFFRLKRLRYNKRKKD